MLITGIVRVVGKLAPLCIKNLKKYCLVRKEQNIRHSIMNKKYCFFRIKLISGVVGIRMSWVEIFWKRNNQDNIPLFGT